MWYQRGITAPGRMLGCDIAFAVFLNCGDTLSTTPSSLLNLRLLSFSCLTCKSSGRCPAFFLLFLLLLCFVLPHSRICPAPDENAHHNPRLCISSDRSLRTPANALFLRHCIMSRMLELCVSLFAIGLASVCGKFDDLTTFALTILLGFLFQPHLIISIDSFYYFFHDILPSMSRLKHKTSCPFMSRESTFTRMLPHIYINI